MRHMRKAEVGNRIPDRTEEDQPQQSQEDSDPAQDSLAHGVITWSFGFALSGECEPDCILLDKRVRM